MAIKIKAYSNCDDTLIVWKPDKPIDDCRGFALFRYKKDKNGIEKKEIVSTWVGFEGESYPQGTRKFSTEWPIQKFLWTDYIVRNGDMISYKVVPMCGAKANMVAMEELASDRTPWMKVGTEQTKGVKAYFNRGIVASQWLVRKMGSIPPNEQKKKLQQIIEDKESKVRQFLAGDVRTEILGLLSEAKSSKSKIYASLYELNDPELIEGLESLGKNANVIFANGSPKKDKPDQNELERKKLHKDDKITIYDRIVKNPHLSHHKFLVICDSKGNAKKVWTGSTNWTKTGLCTQANNGILFENPTIASWFKKQWELLKNAENDYPKSLKQADSKSNKIKLGQSDLTVWFTPLYKEVDMEQARKLIRNAQQGVLFLFFNPGPSKTLLNEIIQLSGSGLLIHGVVNQDPGGNKQQVLKLFNRGQEIKPNLDALIPAAIEKTLPFWKQELKRYSIAMIHSKVVIIDPFGKKPVVMTGSHNMGPKASRSNDDNLVIIENAPGLAAEYAVNIMSIYNQYKWRHNQLTNKKSQQWKGLVDRDDWQDDLHGGTRLDEVMFWLGEYKRKIKETV